MCEIVKLIGFSPCRGYPNENETEMSKSSYQKTQKKELLEDPAYKSRYYVSGLLFSADLIPGPTCKSNRKLNHIWTAPEPEKVTFVELFSVFIREN